MPRAAGDTTTSQAIYRFFSNPQVQPSQILGSHRAGVLSRIQACSTVLAIQDTTDLNFTSHPKTTGLGYINQTQQQGIKVHSSLAVSGAGQPLGLLHQQCWIRPERSGKKRERKTTPIQDKESYRWLSSLQAAEVGLPQSVQLVHVGDREADIFELFALPRQANSELLIRAEHNRKVQHELGHLIAAINQAPILGSVTLELARNPQRAARVAPLQLRAMQVCIEVPRNHPKPHALEPVSLNVMLVEETEQPPEGTQPIRWLLLTSLAIDSFEAAWQAVRWYSYRWLIERFHFTLKSGCRLEQLQLQTKQRLLNALATYSIVAWRLMDLTYQARLRPDSGCELVLETREWKLLRRKFEPKNRSKRPPTLHQAMVWIAQLGGFLARKGDGEPGLKTIWLGLGKLHHLLEGAQLAAKS